MTVAYNFESPSRYDDSSPFALPFHPYHSSIDAPHPPFGSQAILDSVLFEPGEWRPLEALAPSEEVPARDRTPLATPFGLLFNELVHSPSATLQVFSHALSVYTCRFLPRAQLVACCYPLIRAPREYQAVCEMLEGALELDVGYCDPRGATAATMYMLRLAVRVEEYALYLERLSSQPEDPAVRGRRAGGRSKGRAGPFARPGSQSSSESNGGARLAIRNGRLGAPTCVRAASEAFEPAE